MDVQPTPFAELTVMKKVKRIIVAMVGGTVLALGIALMVLPGPAFLVIPAGLAILAVEFAWARRWLRAAREFVQGNVASNGDYPGATVRLTALGKLKHRVGAIVSGAVFVVAFALLALAGAGFVAIPAVLGILTMEFKRVRRWLRNGRNFLLRANPLPGKDTVIRRLR